MDMAKTVRQKPDRRTTTVKAPVATADDQGGATPDAIARRAFEVYCARGGGHGQDVDDWLQAERELTGAKTT